MITVPVGEDNSVRVAITFLSPELVRAASLIDEMDENPNNPSLYLQASQDLSNIATGNSFLFFLAVFPISSGSADDTPHTIQLDIEQLILVNAGGLEVRPVSYDHNLDQRFPPTQTADGYVYFPISVDAGKGCRTILDNQFDRKLIFELSEIRIDDAVTGPYSWTIQYTYLLIRRTSITTGRVGCRLKMATLAQKTHLPTARK